jgi:hypothetical protein
MKTSIVALKETLAVLELAETIETPLLQMGLCATAAKALVQVSKTLSTFVEEPTKEEPAKEEPAQVDDRAPSLYNQFISEMSGAARKTLPGKSQKERFHMLAALWTRHKALGDLEEIKAAALKDLASMVPVATPVFSVSIKR